MFAAFVMPCLGGFVTEVHPDPITGTTTEPLFRLRSTVPCAQSSHFPGKF